MATFILRKNEQMVQSFPIGRLRRLEEQAAAGGGAGGVSFVDSETVSGSGTSFTLANAPVAGSVRLYALGQRLTQGTDYSISGTSITTVGTWSAGDILADYRK